MEMHAVRDMLDSAQRAQANYESDFMMPTSMASNFGRMRNA
jgi:hypothetical protein